MTIPAEFHRVSSAAGVTGSTKIVIVDVDSALVPRKSADASPAVPRNAVAKLSAVHKDGYMVVLVSSAPGHGARSPAQTEICTRRMESIKAQLGIPVLVVETGGARFRKPRTGVWDLVLEHNRDASGVLVVPDRAQCIFVGALAGQDRESDVDIKFAANLGIQFMIPDQFFDGCMMRLKYPAHPTRDVPTVDHFDYSQFGREHELVILVGPPGCGKSTFCRNPVFSGHLVISPEKFKVRAKMLAAIATSAASVIVDRRNETLREREEFIKIARTRNMSVKVVHFDVSKALCRHLCAYRELVHGQEIPLINITKFYSHLELTKDMIKFDFFIDESKIPDKPLFYSFLN